MSRVLSTTAVAVSGLIALTACGGSSSGGDASSAAKSAALTTSSAKSSASSATSSATSTPASASSSATGSATGSSTAAPTASPTGSPRGSASTTPSAAAAGSMDKAVEKFDFGNATWDSTPLGKVKLVNGSKELGSGIMDGYLSTKQLGEYIPFTPLKVYGDLNGDDFEDAVVEIGWAQSNGVGTQPYVWLGGEDGPQQLPDQTIAGNGRCGDEISSIKIVNRQIVVKGKLLGDSCAAARVKPFTRTYEVTKAGKIRQVSGPR